MKQTRQVVYRGKVGANTRPKPHRINKRVAKERCALRDGPIKGHVLYLESNTTLQITYKGQTGRYVSGVWEAA